MNYSNIYTKDGNIIRQPLYDGSLSDADCKTKFLAEMTAKASALGMSNTIYVSPSGMTTDNRSTAQDALKLGIAVCGNSEALKVWHTQSQNFSIGGSHARTVGISNNVISGSATDLGAYYKVLGGKGGSLSYTNGVYHRAQILLVEVDNLPVILSLMAYGQTAYENIYKSAKELADMVKDTIEGNTPTEGTNLATLVSNNGGYAGCVVPNIPTAFDMDYTSALFVARNGVVKNGESTVRVPASTTKTMTMLCALEHITNLDAPITIKTADIEGGSGTTFYDGDIVKARDALRIMMMESSNTMAQAICRTVGGYLLQRG